MNVKTQSTDTDEELIGILTAISVVSKRLARNLTELTAQSKTQEGGRTDEQKRESGQNHKGTAQIRCEY